MFTLDPRSVMLLAGVLGLLMSVVLYFLSRSYPRSIRGLREWAVGPVLFCAGAVATSAGDAVPQAVSEVVGNCLLLWGAIVVYGGSQQFLKQPSTTRSWLWITGAAAPVFLWFTLVQPADAVRVAVFTFLMAAVYFAHAALLMVRGGGTFASRFTAAALLVVSVLLALRFLSTLASPYGANAFEGTLLQTAYVAGFACSVLLVAIGGILMASDRLQSELEHLASHDPLTGSLTRGALFSVCDEELERARRSHRGLALMMVDLDHFKSINDRHGHQCGDLVLRDFIARAKAQLRLPDRIGRYGGEEFVVLLPDTSLAEALGVAERMRQAAAETRDERQLPPYTISIGVAACRLQMDTVDALLARADAALYRAKSAGRNRVEAADHLAYVCAATAENELAAA